MTSKESKQIKDKGNEIIRMYTTGVRTYKDIQNMYACLESIGITTGLIHGDNKSCEWYYRGEEMQDSLYCVSIYKYDSGRLDINAYLS